MNFVYWLSKYSGNTHERRAVYIALYLAGIVSGGLDAVQLVIRLESSFTFIHSANALRQRRLSRGQRQASRKQERKKASKQESVKL